MTSFVLKIIAIAAMLVDHIGYTLGNNITMRIIGRLAFPIFAFQFAVSCTKTKNVKKFAFRLFLFAIISFIPFYLFQRINYIDKFSIEEMFIFDNNFGIKAPMKDLEIFNIMFTMLMGLFVIKILDQKLENYTNSKDIFVKIFFWIIKTILISSLLLITYCLKTDYSVQGVLLILGFYLAIKMGNKYLLLVSISAFTLYEYFFSYRDAGLTTNQILLMTLFTMMPVILMIRFNGKKGPSLKYLFYIFYPVHFLVLFGLKYFNVI